MPPRHARGCAHRGDGEAAPKIERTSRQLDSANDRRSPRRQRLAGHVHACGARAVFEALLAVEAGQRLDEVLEDFLRVTPEICRALGADRRARRGRWGPAMSVQLELDLSVPGNGRSASFSFACLDSGTDTNRINEYYVVNNELWLSVNPADAGMLCIGCLEKRLGRRLTPDDFEDAPVNTWPTLHRSRRLLDRLGRGKIGSAL
jgi:hypothetical protein